MGDFGHPFVKSFVCFSFPFMYRYVPGVRVLVVRRLADGDVLVFLDPVERRVRVTVSTHLVVSKKLRFVNECIQVTKMLPVSASGWFGSRLVNRSDAPFVP